MKSIKDGMKDIRLSDEKKRQMTENIKRAGEASAQRARLPLAGIACAAAALVLVALSAAVFSFLPTHSDNIAQGSEKSSELKDNKTADIGNESSVGKAQPESSDKEGVQPSRGGSEIEKAVSENEQLQFSGPSRTESDPQPEPSRTESSPQPEPSRTESSSQPEPSRTESDPQPEPSYTESSPQPEPSYTESSPQPEPSRTESCFLPEPTAEIGLAAPEEDIIGGEYAGDMYRPEGYPGNIGSGLALKMDITGNSAADYAVLIQLRRLSLEDILPQLKAPVDVDRLSRVNVISGYLPFADNTYFAYLTAEQIFSLAENGARLSYVGSGEGDIRNMGFDTPERITNYVELNGDEYILRDGVITSTNALTHQGLTGQTAQSEGQESLAET